jgi:hypothetical protein
MIKEMDIFGFLQGAQNFLKRAARDESHSMCCRRRRNTSCVPPAVHVGAAADQTQRLCKPFYLPKAQQQCCELTSSAA